MAEKNKKIDDIVDYLFEKDEISFVLKLHLDIEQHIDALIEKIFLKPNYFLSRTFADKVKTLHSIGLIDESTTQHIIQFNQIRNKFSHQYRYRLSQEDLTIMKNIYGNRPINIPDRIKQIPNIEIMIILIQASGYLTGRLSYLQDIAKKIDILSMISTKNIIKNQDIEKNTNQQET